MKKKGFSLVELLVVITIIVIFTAIAIPNLRKGEDSFALQRAAHKLAQDLRIAANMALSGKVFPPPPFPPGGYGIYFPSPSASDYVYTLFKDDNNNKIYDSQSERIEDLKFEEKRITVESISPTPPLNIVFFPPDPNVTIKNQAGTSTQAQIIVRQGNERFGVRVYLTGLIEVFRP